jgi:hypothetical protein
MNLRRRGYVVALLVSTAAGFAACRTAQPAGETPSPTTPSAEPRAPVRDIPPPVHRTPTTTLPPVTIETRPSLRSEIERIADSVIAAPAWQAAQWGMLVVDATTGDTLLSRNAN